MHAADDDRAAEVLVGLVDRLVACLMHCLVAFVDDHKLDNRLVEHLLAVVLLNVPAALDLPIDRNLVIIKFMRLKVSKH